MRTERMVRRVVGGSLAALLSLAMWAGPVAHASQNPAAPSRATLAASTGRPALPARVVRYKYTLSRIAWTGSRIVIAATDTHGDLYYYWKPYTTTKWHQQLVAKGGRRSGYSHPSIAWTSNAVIIAALDASGDLVVFSSHAGNGPWRHKLLAKASGIRWEVPSVTATPTGTVLISVARQSLQLWSFELAAGHTTWTKQLVSIGGAFGAPSISTCFDKLISQYLALITATSGGILYFWWERLDIPGWNQEVVANPNSWGSYTGGSIAATANDILLTASTTDGHIDFWSQPIGHTGWAQQIVASGGGALLAHPAIAWTGPVGGSLLTYDVITATNHAGRLEYWWKIDGGTVWNPQSIAAPGRKAAYANPGIAVTGRSVVITAINTKPGDVLYWYQPYLTSPWHGQIVAVG
jgi:hypothetical protein